MFCFPFFFFLCVKILITTCKITDDVLTPFIIFVIFSSYPISTSYLTKAKDDWFI